MTPPAERKRRQRQRAVNEHGEYVTVTVETVLAAIVAGVRDLAASPNHKAAVEHLIDRAVWRFEFSAGTEATDRIREFLDGPVS